MADDEVAELLREVLVELRGIRAALERRSDVDRPEVAALLIAIFEAVGTRAFSGPELIDYAEVSSNARLLAACGSNARKLGRIFRRIEGEACAGLRVERVGDSRAGIVWRVAGFRGESPALACESA